MHEKRSIARIIYFFHKIERSLLKICLFLEKVNSNQMSKKLKKKEKAAREYDKLLDKYISKKRIVRINRVFRKTKANIQSYILQKSSSFILLQNEEEFSLNGFSIIRKDQFNSIRYNQYDKTTEKILKKKGIRNQYYGLNFNINLTNWESIFLKLQKEIKYIIIECENKSPSEFYIGRIEKVKKKSLHLRYFSATGLLDKKTTLIKFKKITLVKFGDRYSQIFSQFLIEKK